MVLFLATFSTWASRPHETTNPTLVSLFVMFPMDSIYSVFVQDLDFLVSTVTTKLHCFPHAVLL